MRIVTCPTAALGCALVTAVLTLPGAAEASAQTPAAARCINDRFADGHMVLHFEAAQLCDNVAITSLDAPQGARVRLSDGSRSVLLSLHEGHRGETVARLRTALRGTDFTVAVDSAGAEAVCLTDVSLSAGTRRLKPQMRPMPASAPTDDAVRFVGVWSTTLSNRVHATLTMQAGGSWHLQTQAGAHEGDWQMQAGKLHMRLGHDGDFVAMHVITQVVPSAPSGRASAAQTPKHTVLLFDGQLLSALSGTFDNAGML